MSFGGGGFANISYYPYPAIYFDATNTTGYTQVSSTALDPSEKTLLIFAAGQSRLTNYPGTTLTDPADSKLQMFNPYDATLYQLKDSVLGMAGGGGSYLTRLGVALKGAAVGARIIFVPLAISGTSTNTWITYPYLNRIEVCCRLARAQGWAVPQTNFYPMIIWENGQTDVAEGTTSATYQANIKKIQYTFAQSGFAVPFFVAQSTMDTNVTNSTIRAAQAALVDNSELRYAGPDTDTLTGTGNLQDGTHFTTTGLTNVANLWRTSIDAVF